MRCGNLLVCFASLAVASAFSSPPRAAATALDKFTLRVPDEHIREFQTILTVSKVGSKTWYDDRGDSTFGTTRRWLAGAKQAWLKLNWRKQEKRINSVPNFKFTVNDADVGATTLHFAALFSTKEDAIPLLFLHGWPGSFLEFLPMLDLLRKKYTPETLPYHIIVPSLPHYGLSGGPSHVELTLDAAARLLHQLMADLGFGDGFAVQGGDIGSFLARILCAEYSTCKAFHINMLAPSSPDELLSSDNLTQEEVDHVQRMLNFSTTGSAYILEHGQRPSTIGLALSSSPLALLSWIGEKLIEWPDQRYPLPLETILTLVSFYWYTDTFPRSLYPYRALAASASSGGFFSVPTSKEKPFGYSVFPAENILVPEAWAEQIYPNLAFYKRHDKARIGGHFAALEQPEALLQDVEEFLAKAWLTQT
ncbi:Alpha/Beta hydrolase protein [Ilyonectria robusta]|uniref:Alpha/Beta hydrolase protein n=1 Tax=Ilyonectria robusta TaxID=1079257 RepID=UPI001E8CB0D2|nr:Alpha/Beta hydrolase protein [Ilyonectria robusta]KAH8651663.1 Alpha/Beta hydrolase protein [Ilyonectria robusta]